MEISRLRDQVQLRTMQQVSGDRGMGIAEVMELGDGRCMGRIRRYGIWNKQAKIYGSFTEVGDDVEAGVLPF